MIDDNEFFDDYNPDYDDAVDCDDDASDVLPCPVCGADVYEDSPRCPVCGNYITPSVGGPWTGRPLWWIALGAMGVVALIVALVGWMR